MTAGLDVSAGLELAIGTLNDRLAKDAAARIWAREIDRARVPVVATLKASATIPTPTAPMGLNFGGPDAGFEWCVRRLVVGGLTWGTTAAGTFEAYVTGLGGILGASSGGGGASNPAGVRMMTDLVEQGSMPFRAFYAKNQMTVKENESLVVVVAAGTQAQQYVASAHIQVFRTAMAGAWQYDDGI